MDVVMTTPTDYRGAIGFWTFLAAIAVATAAHAEPIARAPDPTRAEIAVKLGDPPPMPDDFKINLLIRTTIVAVNQANKTGNYAVLHELGAPGFQAANTPAQLADTFEKQRKSKFDLSPILFFNPKLVEKPHIDPSGMLRLTGFFETRPQQVNFDLVFEYVDGDWHHFALGIGTQLSKEPAATK